jgi:hypothetical protein
MRIQAPGQYFNEFHRPGRFFAFRRALRTSASHGEQREKKIACEYMSLHDLYLHLKRVFPVPQLSVRHRKLTTTKN